MTSRVLVLLFSVAIAGSSVLAAQNVASDRSKKVDATSAHITSEADRPVVLGGAERFIGKVSVAPLFSAEAPSRVSAAYVTFEPGARTAWHTHPVGQHLVVTRGTGYVQFWGSDRRKITQGDVVWIPPGQKHWHGATPESSMTHLAVQENLNGKTSDWMEQVSDEQYGVLPALTAAKQPSRAQQIMGETAPKLAELTDQVLYNDIWERPELSKRDRSLITVSALIALNRPDQLRSHFALAQRNGVTQVELVEAITHLAFYTGWPSAVSAISIAKDVFQENQSPPTLK